MSVSDPIFWLCLVDSSPQVVLVSHKPAQCTLRHRGTVSPLMQEYKAKSMKRVCMEKVAHCWLLSSAEWGSRERGIMVTAFDALLLIQKSHIHSHGKAKQQSNNKLLPAHLQK